MPVSLFLDSLGPRNLHWLSVQLPQADDEIGSFGFGDCDGADLVVTGLPLAI